MRWRLLLTDPAPGAWNMAVDETLARQVEAGACPPTLRFYGWQPPCLSLGYNQPWQVANEEFCRQAGVEITRRPTGGRAVLHHWELTYSVAAPLGQPPFSHSLQENYQRICQALVAGLRALGIDAQLSLGQGRPLLPQSAAPCFIAPAAGEVVVGGKKLVGSAMRRWGRVLLQHGSLLLAWDGKLQAGVLGMSEDAPLRAAVVTVQDLLPALPSQRELVEALAQGFAQVLGVELEPGSLLPEEVAWAQYLAREIYGHPRFVVGRERPQEPGTGEAKAGLVSREGRWS